MREVCRYNTFNRPALAYDRVLEKCFCGLGKSWKSPGNFFNQDSGNPEFLSITGLLSYLGNLYVFLDYLAILPLNLDILQFVMVYCGFFVGNFI